MQSDELGHCIRVWRDRLDPAAAGLTAGAGRRARLGELVLEGVPG